jgi:3-phenylpropionate/trans-cinnamate dioxygenase ferredoxin reductase subunit
MAGGVVIVGGGQAGFQTASSLRSEGYDGPIRLIGEEPHIPYQRPPLSKAFVLGKQDQTRILLRPEKYYAEHLIDLLTGERAVSIDTADQSVTLASGGRIPYDNLVLASGARNRTLPIPGAELEGVCYLRTLSEAVELKQRIENARDIAVIGGGFIGLEIAASARTLGKTVTVLEAFPRLMARVVAPVVSEFFRSAHTERGVQIKLGVQVQKIRGAGRKAESVLLSDGSSIPADLVVVGIGVQPNLEIACEAGLETAAGPPHGITVDEFLRTRDSRIFAIGDCAEYLNTFAAARVRLESVQNAVDQAVCVARNIAGKPGQYQAAPWFWSDQFDLRLQMVGLPAGHDQTVVRGSAETGKFSVFYYNAGRLRAVDSINSPIDHVAARKMIAAGTSLSPEQAADLTLNLKTL